MNAIIIHGTDKKNTRLISELAKKLGAKVSGLTENQYEDLMLGQTMEKIKTDETVSKTDIVNLLK